MVAPRTSDWRKLPRQHRNSRARERPVGTAAYTWPEQTAGEITDHRTDIWALGVVLHEIATGQAPFRIGMVAEIDSCRAVGLRSELFYAERSQNVECPRIFGLRCLI